MEASSINSAGSAFFHSMCFSRSDEQLRESARSLWAVLLIHAPLCKRPRPASPCHGGLRGFSLGVIMKNILCKFYYGWIFLFHLGKNIRVMFLPVFRSHPTTLCFHQQHIKIPVAPQSCQLLVLTVFSILAISKLVK